MKKDSSQTADMDHEKLMSSIDDLLTKDIDYHDVDKQIAHTVIEYIKSHQKETDVTWKEEEVCHILDHIVADAFHEIEINEDLIIGDDAILEEKSATDKDKKKLSQISDKSKQDLKKSISNFINYQIYKVMNPRRIAGETEKDNYSHNLYMGGKGLAQKHLKDPDSHPSFIVKTNNSVKKQDAKGFGR